MARPNNKTHPGVLGFQQKQDQISTVRRCKRVQQAVRQWLQPFHLFGSATSSFGTLKQINQMSLFHRNKELTHLLPEWAHMQRKCYDDWQLTRKLLALQQVSPRWGGCRKLKIFSLSQTSIVGKPACQSMMQRLHSLTQRR